MASSSFVLGWSSSVAGVDLIGRPLSGAGFHSYNRHAVKGVLAMAIPYARQMTTETLALVQRSLPAAIERRMGTAGPLGYSSTISPIVEKAAVDHFKVSPLSEATGNQWAELLKHLAQAYTMIAAGIGGRFSMVDIPYGDPDKGSCSVRGATLLDNTDPDGLRVGARGRIHVNFNWIPKAKSPQRVARTIVHEASHKFIGARDHAYKWDKQAYQNLTAAQAWANADSIACFAYYTWKNGAYSLDAS